MLIVGLGFLTPTLSYPSDVDRQDEQVTEKEVGVAGSIQPHSAATTAERPFLQWDSTLLSVDNLNPSSGTKGLLPAEAAHDYRYLINPRTLLPPEPGS